MKTFLRNHTFELAAAAFVLLAVGLWLLGHPQAALLLPAMAYPTTLSFHASQAGEIGQQQLALTDTTQRHPLGKRCKFIDPTYGEIEAIYLKGVASTAAGDLVVYDPKAGTTTRSVAASRGPVAVAMSANVALQFGWYAIQGLVPVSTTAAGTGAANAGLAVTATPGQATVRAAAGQSIDGLICKSAQDGPGAGFTDVELHYPSANGIDVS
jgi:hypothetical protein